MENVVVKCAATEELYTFKSKDEAFREGMQMIIEASKAGYSDDDCKVTFWDEVTHEYLGGMQLTTG